MADKTYGGIFLRRAWEPQYLEGDPPTNGESKQKRRVPKKTGSPQKTGESPKKRGVPKKTGSPPKNGESPPPQNGKFAQQKREFLEKGVNVRKQWGEPC